MSFLGVGTTASTEAQSGLPAAQVGAPHPSAPIPVQRPELGGNTVHTADAFSAGRSEHIIGQWIRSRGLRDEVVLAVRVGGHADNPGLGSVNLVRAVEASLTRLGTDHIDVLYLDASGTDSPLEDTLATAEWLLPAGKARALGAFGFTAERLVEARILASAGYPR